MGEMQETAFAVRLKWLILIICTVLVTIVGLLLLHRDVTNEEKAPPTYVYQPAETETKTEEPYSGQKLDLNLANKEQLESLPGVGEALAERIVAYRKETPFKVVRDLKKVPGIGDKKFSAICEYVYVEPLEEVE